MSALRVCIAGAAGRMGRTLIELLRDDPRLALSAALEIAGSPAVGQDAASGLGFQAGVAIASDVDLALAASDVLIDFTRPAGTLAHLAACERAGCAAVVGTTGFTAEQRACLEGYGQRIPLVFAPNFSVGVNLLLDLVATAARVLREGYDIEIIEAHHRHKVDAPSGTALRIGEVIAQAVGRSLADCAVYGREGVTGERDPATIGFATVRGGDIVGDHTALFAGIGERIEISHKASHRATFARGALRAAEFLRDRPAGLYGMDDVLGLGST